MYMYVFCLCSGIDPNNPSSVWIYVVTTMAVAGALLYMYQNVSEEITWKEFVNQYLGKGVVRKTYSPTCSEDHMLIKTVFTGPQLYTFHAIEPAYKDHLCIRTTFCWSLGWSLYSSFTVAPNSSHSWKNPLLIVIESSNTHSGTCGTLSRSQSSVVLTNSSILCKTMQVEVITA